MEPFEIIGAPLEVYVAPSGTAFPDLDEAPGAPWALLGTNGTRSQDEDGLTLTHGQTVNDVRAAGSTGPIKAFRAEEELVIAFNLMDLTLETYAMVLNGATVADVAPGAGALGTRTIGLSRGFGVEEFAMLMRLADGPYGPDLPAQYEVPRVYESASAAPQFTKGQPAILACEFRAMEDLNPASEAERFGRLVAADAPATP
jgi:hypothetical protein